MNFLKKTIVALSAIMLVFSQPIRSLQAATYFYHTDHLGTPQVVTNADQQVVWQQDRSPFGEADSSTTAALVKQNLRFPGQYLDVETGLHYNYFRTYDPTLGRNTQSDPAGLLAGVSRYGYANQSPAVNIDPSGLYWYVIPAIVVVAAGVAVGVDIFELKKCVEQCPTDEECNDRGDNRINLGCKQECVLRGFGKPSGPGPTLP